MANQPVGADTTTGALPSVVETRVKNIAKTILPNDIGALAKPANGTAAGLVPTVQSDGSISYQAIPSSGTQTTVDGTPVSTLAITSTAVTASDVGAIAASTVTAKGDLLAGTGSSAVSRVALGTNGQVLTADSTVANGVKWATPSAGGTYTDEQAQDAAAALFTGGTHSGISFVYDDAGNVVNATVTGGGGGTDPDAWLGYASTVMAPSASASLITAGRIFFARVSVGKKTGATKIGLQVVTSSGNIMVGVYRATGTGTSALPGALAVGTAVVACPAAGYSEITLPSAVDVAKGDYLALWCDNTTATFAYIGNSAAIAKSVSAYYDAGTGITALPAGPITPASINGFARDYYLTAA